MIYAILSLVVSFVITVGRQSAVFGRIRSSLWFFRHFEEKRLIFTLVAILLAAIALYTSPDVVAIRWISGLAVMLLLSVYLFDFKYIFPEVKTVERAVGHTLNLESHMNIIGVKVDNIAVAYPLDVVVSRHLINDKIGLTPVVVSYCAICRSGLVFSATADGEEFYFAVAGVWRRNMIMVDDKTKSLWQQATGECIYGPHKGKQLELLSGENTNWGSWSSQHPESLYAAKCIEARRGLFSRAFMLKGLEFATSRMTPPGFSDLSDLPSRETVFGIHYNGVSKAYPESNLKGMSDFTDTYDFVEVVLNYDAQANYLLATDKGTNKKLIVEKHWWLGWKEFHPETIIWDKNN